MRRLDALTARCLTETVEIDAMKLAIDATGAARHWHEQYACAEANWDSEVDDMMDAADRLKADKLALSAALRRLMRDYVSLLESGRERIVARGGSCDSVETMERDDPFLKLANAALSKHGGEA